MEWLLTRSVPWRVLLIVPREPHKADVVFDRRLAKQDPSCGFARFYP